MLDLHTAEGEETGKLKLAHRISTGLAQLLSLKLYPHAGDVLCGLFDHCLHFIGLLLRENSHHGCRLDKAAEDGKATLEVTFGRQIDSLGHLVFKGTDRDG